MITGIAHVCIDSQDLDRTRHFYCDILGCTIQFRFMRKEQLIGFYLRVAEHHFIEAFLKPQVAVSETATLRHLCLETDDIHGLRKKLLEHSVETSEPKLGLDQSWQVWCKDPDGTPIEFHQYTPKSTQLTGKDCEANW